MNSSRFSASLRPPEDVKSPIFICVVIFISETPFVFCVIRSRMKLIGIYSFSQYIHIWITFFQKIFQGQFINLKVVYKEMVLHFATSFLCKLWIYSAKCFANLQLYCTLFPSYLKITVLPGTAVEIRTNKISEDNTANKISFLQLRSQ